MASSLDPKLTKSLASKLTDSDSGVRYWAALGLQMRGAEAVKTAHSELRRMLQDQSPAARIAAAETLGKFGNADDVSASLKVLTDLASPEKNGAAVAILAMNGITTLGDKAKPALDFIRSMQIKDPNSPARMQEYPRRLQESLTRDLSHS
jgi:uncharacterized sulfatase